MLPHTSSGALELVQWVHGAQSPSPTAAAASDSTTVGLASATTTPTRVSLLGEQELTVVAGHSASASYSSGSPLLPFHLGETSTPGEDDTTMSKAYGSWTDASLQMSSIA